MENTTYHIPVGQMTRPDPIARRAEGDRWVSLRSLRNQPHVSAGVEHESKAPVNNAAVPLVSVVHPYTKSIYLSVIRRHENAKRLVQSKPAIQVPILTDDPRSSTGIDLNANAETEI